MEYNGKILLIEDNYELNNANSRALKLRNYEVVIAETLSEARKQLALQEPDIILLDVMLPDGDGMEFCAEIRRCVGSHIIFLTAKTNHASLIKGLADGGDDYITKPFHPEELLARIDATMRHRSMDKEQTLTLVKGGLIIDIVSARVFFNGSDLSLTPKEFSLLFLLAQNERKLFSAKEVYEAVWKAPLVGDKNSLQAIISKLRYKLENTGYTISSRRRYGYMFQREE